MAETTRDRINTYLVDTIAAERNFDNALAAFSKSGVQDNVQAFFAYASAKAKTQHERLTNLLTSRGGSPSAGKTLLAETLAFTPLTAQLGQGAAEKNTQHLMVCIAAASAEKAMYESLIAAATVSGDPDVVALARELQAEEQDDFEKSWALLRESAAASFQNEIAKGHKAQDLIIAYLEDAIAAEKSFETQLDGFSKEGDNATVQNLFALHARQTRSQYEELTARLNALGGSTSVVKSLLAHIFNFAPKIAQLGYDKTERLTQNLMMAFAVENAEVAMYESLATVARLSGDATTEQLARSIQQQEQETADKVWAQVAPQAQRAMTETDRNSA